MAKPLILFAFVLSLLLCNCTSKRKLIIETGYKIDSSFKLKDSINESICIKFNQGDSLLPASLNFHYYAKVNDKWTLKTKYDSLESWEVNNINTDHSDFNDDGIKDFVFLAEQGVRGARFWENIILYNPEQKRFDYLKGSRQVCAPWFDSIKKRVIGVYTFGSQYLISDYKIINDSLIETSRELWQDDTLMKKIK